VFILCIVVLRETHPPTLLREKAKKLSRLSGGIIFRSALEPTYARKQFFILSIVRPTKMLFMSPIVFSLSLLTATAYGTLYLLFTTVSDLFITRYGIVKNVGLVYLSFGFGQLVGIGVFGAVSDSIVRRLARGGEMKPEYRLPPMVPGAALIPIGLLIYGWSAQYRVFWFVPLTGGFLIGMGMINVFTSVGTYLIDAFPAYAASATAANTVFRSVGGGLLPLAGAKMYAALGPSWGNTLLAGISLGMMAMILLAIKYGEQLRTHPSYQLRL
jgi:MFS family permease